jgi:hypothetical protein
MALKSLCVECQKEFWRSNPWHKFCSYSCQQLWHRRKYAAVRAWWREAGGEAQFEREERSA